MGPEHGEAPDHTKPEATIKECARGSKQQSDGMGFIIP